MSSPSLSGEHALAVPAALRHVLHVMPQHPPSTTVAASNDRPVLPARSRGVPGLHGA